jgi:hypothetical protein
LQGFQKGKQWRFQLRLLFQDRLDELKARTNVRYIIFSFERVCSERFFFKKIGFKITLTFSESHSDFEILQIAENKYLPYTLHGLKYGDTTSN